MTRNPETTEAAREAEEEAATEAAFAALHEHYKPWFVREISGPIRVAVRAVLSVSPAVTGERSCIECGHAEHDDTDCGETVGYDHLNGDHECGCPGRPEGMEVAERLAAARLLNPDATEYEVGWRAGWDKARATVTTPPAVTAAEDETRAERLFDGFGAAAFPEPAPVVAAVPAEPVRELVCNSVGYHLPHGWHNGPGTPRYRCPGNLNPCLCGHHEVDHVAGEHGHQCGACGCESFAPTAIPADPNEED